MTGIRKITDIEKHFSDEPIVVEIRNIAESRITGEKFSVMTGLSQNLEILLSL